MVLFIVRVGRVLLQKIHSAFIMVMAVANEMRLIIRQLYCNGHWFVTNAPPVILFAVCIIIFTLILSALAYYVTITENIRNPDISKDWNMFLESFSKLELCILQHNVSLESIPQGIDILPQPAPPFRHRDHNKNVKWRPWKDGETEKHRVPMPLVVQPTREFVSIPHSLTLLSASIYGKYIGYKGSNRWRQLNVTIVIPYNWEPSLCSDDFSACNTVRVNACVEFLGPKQLFPRSRGPRSVCAARRLDEVEYRAGLNWQMPDVNSFYYCRHRSMIRVIHKLDPSLTVRLSKDQRQTIVRRLVHTCYCLLMLVVAVVLWAVVVNHRKIYRTISTSESYTPSTV